MITHTLSWKDSFLTPPKFTQTNAYKVLQTLVLKAPDLSDPACISKNRVEQYTSKSSDFTLFYGFERVDESILQALFTLAEERQVVQQMKSMLDGNPINWIEGFQSEERAVLHTATRRSSGESSIEKEAVLKSVQERAQLKTVIEDISHQFDTMLFIGIGGSELGPHALCDALRKYWREEKRVYYAGNVDPDELSAILEKIDPLKTVVVVVSKSGTTLETATNEARVRNHFDGKVHSLRDHFICVTCPNTLMDDQKIYRATLHLFDFVGGRYSGTSMVGGIVIGFMAGVSIFEEFLAGAESIDAIATNRNIHQNIPLMMALLGIWNRSFLEYPTVAVIPYSALLHRFPAHLQQCDMESNGKQVTRAGKAVDHKTGPIIWGEPGTNAQHSFFQLLHQGSDIVPVEFIGFREPQFKKDFSFRGTTSQEKLLANLFAQAIALAVGQKNSNLNRQFPGNRPSKILIADALTPHSLGALLAIYEHKIAFQGFIWGINSFDQEGVQLGKLLADRLLQTLSQSPSAINSSSLDATITQIIRGSSSI